MTTSARIGPYVPPAEIYSDEPILFATIRRRHGEITQGDGFWQVNDQGRIEFELTPDEVIRVTLLEGAARDLLFRAVLSLGYPVFVALQGPINLRGGYPAVFMGQAGLGWNSEVASNRKPVYSVPLPAGLVDDEPLLNNFTIEMVDRDRANREGAFVCLGCGQALAGMTLEARAEHIIGHGEMFFPPQVGRIWSQEFLRVQYDQMWGATPMDGDCTCAFFQETETPCKHMRTQRIRIIGE